MKISLIICTYKRPKSLFRLLNSIQVQLRHPDQIVIVDGSTDFQTENIIKSIPIDSLEYYHVKPNQRGLTKQRNFGINKVHEIMDIVAFLDDDTEVEKDYFQILEETFLLNPEVVGVGGLAVNENIWQKKEKEKKYSRFRYVTSGNYVYKNSIRNVVRNYLGLGSGLPSGIMPEFSHNRSIGYPLDSGIYEVDLLIGMSFSFRKTLFNHISFSKYFEGYGLYEDADFSIKAQRYGKNIINSSLKLSHYHDPSGRPNLYQYGMMVVRNGYFVWRKKYPSPTLMAIVKWHLITWYLIIVRGLNIFNSKNRVHVLTEFFGRINGWLSLWFNNPLKMENFQ